MKITVIGAGVIGGNLAAKLSTAGHDVQVADARGPEAVRAEVLESGARAADLADAVQDQDVIVLSIPFGVAGQLAGLFTSVPDETVVIDTSSATSAPSSANCPTEEVPSWFMQVNSPGATSRRGARAAHHGDVCGEIIGHRTTWWCFSASRRTAVTRAHCERHRSRRGHPRPDGGRGPRPRLTPWPCPLCRG
ncbi:NAD(P)-binding domain-containing protein [Streptomyces sp. NPDC006365]|uniref:NAD(P)-binding domain-containing protein n=1 Tax=Streptomyces sp. NPDC006365 TaxID=3364744 RepID=UPI0036836A5F